MAFAIKSVNAGVIFVAPLTLGSGGTQPDYVISGNPGTLTLIDNNCHATAPATSCLLGSSP